MTTAVMDTNNGHMISKDMIVVDVPLNEIFSDNEFNCRGSIAPIDVIDLAHSIERVGLQQPIIVQTWDKMPGKKYRIISGHRRFMAHRVIKKETVSAIIRNELNELDARKLNLEENIKRKDLNMLQEAKALVPFVQARWTQTDIANRLSMPVQWVHLRVNLLRLPEEIQQEAAAGFLTQEHIKQLVQMRGNSDKMFAAVRKIKDAKLRGDKRKIEIAEKKIKPNSKSTRNKTEMLKLLHEIQAVLGNGLATRCLAWAAGEITHLDIYREIRDYAEEQGIRYDIPKELLVYN